MHICEICDNICTKLSHYKPILIISRLPMKIMLEKKLVYKKSDSCYTAGLAPSVPAAKKVFFSIHAPHTGSDGAISGWTCSAVIGELVMLLPVSRQPSCRTMVHVTGVEPAISVPCIYTALYSGRQMKGGRIMPKSAGLMSLYRLLVKTKKGV